MSPAQARTRVPRVSRISVRSEIFCSICARCALAICLTSALVRLSSGRYIKLKVGDRIDGGTVAQISEGELLYNKGRRTLSLSLPAG